MSTVYRYFLGSETRQIDGLSGEPPRPDLWYYEPTDYEGDVLWSGGFLTRAAAERAAQLELAGGASVAKRWQVESFDGGHWTPESNGTYDTEADALAAIESVIATCGWDRDRLRAVEVTP